MSFKAVSILACLPSIRSIAVYFLMFDASKYRNNHIVDASFFRSFYIFMLQVKENEKYKASLSQAMWCNHKLYKENNVKDLRAILKEIDLPTEGVKHDLVRRIAESENEQAPEWSTYTGDLSRIPGELEKIMRLSCGKLKEIMKFHGFCTDEKKEVLAMRLFSLRTAETHNMYQREINEMLNLLEICQKLITAQKMLYDSTLVSGKSAFKV